MWLLINSLRPALVYIKVNIGSGSDMSPDDTAILWPHITSNVAYHQMSELKMWLEQRLQAML